MSFRQTAGGLNKAQIAKPEINLGGMFHLVCGNVAFEEALYFREDDKIYKKFE
ncbi:MAG: hypothetical protein RMX96_19670 [Nostoc sp. ChiSLP02]|nr:hypothetical protein [Nostoc sp. DedSLP05]MDZ8097464.1 hypothetical protein [Nostoc sp. DedSLP01]MDZ8187052.1 hypothetical protein [Nostoc sp. ChiSLP02]